MRSPSFRLALLLAVLAASAAAAPGTPQPAGASGSSPLGRWLTESGNLEVGIAPCGAALCGTVLRVMSDRAMSASGAASQAGGDGQKALGLGILQDLTPAGDGEWQGRIYNRDNGKTYDCVIALADADTLKVRPYKFLTLFGKTQLWHRVGADVAQH